ncbi:energy transducer TonB [Acinetobacter gyllenbergii]|uniref:energy transducer TonB n=1 Tax=Acinetobacter gyllenbergii TaxID=134534 RepID=UPI0008068405|nr:TonB C-terminal domain-containing protein [Acinetobacter gyllenbergii]OBY75284.1 hypothetical protein NG55_00990 [Acinetobacter gyllenbergii]
MLKDFSILAISSLLIFSMQAGAALTELEDQKSQLANPIEINLGEYKYEDISSMKDIWVSFPKMNFSKSDLENKNREIEVLLFVDETGLVGNVHVLKSSGLKNLDNKVSDYLKSGARTKPLVFYGKPYKFSGIQKLVLLAE